MNAEEINFSDKYDIAFSNATLHWVKNNRAVLNGVKNCLKPGGKILFQMGGRGNGDEVYQTVIQIAHKDKWEKYFRNFSNPYFFSFPEEYKSWLKETGFRAVRVELMEKDMQHKGKEGLKGWFRTTWFPVTDNLPENMREDFIDEVVDFYVSGHPLDDSGNTHVKMVRLEVEALIVD